MIKMDEICSGYCKKVVFTIIDKTLMAFCRFVDDDHKRFLPKEVIKCKVATGEINP